MLRIVAATSIAAVLAGPVLSAGPGEEPIPADHARTMQRGLELFQRYVGPLLIERCVGCHGGETIEAKFSLNTREDLLRGGTSGAAVRPGESKTSRLYRLITHAEQPHMPYEEDKLSDEQIAWIAEWIECGVPYEAPLVAVTEPPKDWTQREVPPESRAFWSYQPLSTDGPPPVEDADRCRSPVDRFILARLEAKGLTLNPETDRRRLARRVHYDLIGLPPDPEVLEAFVNDPAPDAYERLVERLLASPHLGERWGRHWLDLARFAESHGFEHDYDRPSAYHFRDFVIRAFNQDLPFDVFVSWQLAGDELAPDDNLALMATGFLAAGVHSTQITKNEVEKHRYDEMDDMIATTGTAMLGLTIGCARCHDHKYDPIPQRDYYRLLSAFTTTVRSEVELEFDKQQYRALRQEFDTAHAALESELREFENRELPRRFIEWEQGRGAEERPEWVELDVADFQSAAGATHSKLDDGTLLITNRPEKADTYTVVAETGLEEIRAVRLEVLWHPTLPALGPGLADDGNFALTDFRLSAAPADGSGPAADVPLREAAATFSQQDRPIQAAIDGDGDKSAWSVGGQTGASHAASFEIDGSIGQPGATRLTFTLSCKEAKGHLPGRFRLSVSRKSAGADRDRLTSVGVPERVLPLWDLSPDERSEAQTRELSGWYRRIDDEWQQLNSRVDEHLKQAPRPNLVKVLVSSEGLDPIRLHSQGADFFEDVFFLGRGDPNQKQGEASPGYLQVLMTAPEQEARWKTEPPPESRTSFRRTALSRWMTDVEQGAGALLARVIVNRLWQYHLGTGIVATPSDFGSRGSPPSHPALLDWLARQLIEHDWQLKPIHRLIVTSSVYRQRSAENEAAARIDPENTLFHRHPYRRLEAEVVRDAALAVSGQLDRRQLGPGTLEETSRRRSIYFTVKRSQLISMMQVFDAPDALSGIAERPSTTIAPQALFLLNNTMMRECAHTFADRLEANSGESLADAVQNGYAIALGRPPDDSELSATVAFLERQTASYEELDRPQPKHLALTDFAQMLLCLNEFIYVE